MGTVATAPYRKLLGKTQKRSKRHMIRFGILMANLVVLAAVFGVVLRSPNSSEAIRQNAISSADPTSVTSALDQISSADIAVHIARITQLPEAPSVANQADSVNAQLSITPSNNTVIAKPQVVATALKSRRDIQKYVTQPGDTVGSLAAKFGITSETIRWSNGLTGDSLSAGRELIISPVSGVVYKVNPGDTADSLARKFNANKDQIIAFNDAEVSGLPAGEYIVIPDGIQVAARTASVSYYSGFAWGGSAIYGANGYDYGWCTWYVALRRSQIGRPVPSNLGNAYSWFYIAANNGLPTGSAPQVGAVAVNTAGNHVSVVEQVNPDGSFWVSEMNSRGQVGIDNPTPTGGWGVRDYKLYGSPGSLRFIY